MASVTLERWRVYDEERRRRDRMDPDEVWLYLKVQKAAGKADVCEELERDLGWID